MTAKKSKKTTKRKTMKKTGAAKKTSKKAEPKDENERVGSIKGGLLLEYRAALAEAGEARAQSTLAQVLLQVEQPKPQYVLLNKLLRENNSARVMAGTKADELIEVQRRIAAKLGFSSTDFNQYTINEDTGTVFFSPDTSS